MNKPVILILIIILSGCVSTPQIAIDPKSIADPNKYTKDMRQCREIAESYDLSEGMAANTLLGAAAGGTAVAGIATAIAGAVFWPAIPFIVAGTVFAGSVAGGSTKAKETHARENILLECMRQRGYRVYSARSITPVVSVQSPVIADQSPVITDPSPVITDPSLVIADPSYKNVRGVLLMNGEIIEGQVLSIKNLFLRIQTKDGQVLTFSFEREIRQLIMN